MKQLIFTLLLTANCLIAYGQCNPQTTFSDDFESYTAGSTAGLPTCWQSQGTFGQMIGTRNNAGAAHSGANYISIYTFFTANATTYIISPELSTIDGNHFAEFYVNVEFGDVVLEYGTMSDPANTTTTFSTVSNASLVVNTYTKITTAAIPQSGGHKYFAIKFTSPTMHTAIKIDDFSWNVSTSTVTCDAPLSLQTANVVENGANISWNAVSGAQSYKTEYGVAGFTQGSGTVGSSSTNSMNLTGLIPQTTYDVYVTTNCGNSSLSSASKISFTTVASTLGLENIEKNTAISIYPNPASDILNIELPENLSNSEITVFNLLGQKVFSAELNGTHLTLDISTWEKGIYLVRTDNTAASQLKKLVIE